MTENQAIKILEEEKSWESDDRKIDAFIMAIEALKSKFQRKSIILQMTIHSKQVVAELT